MIFTTIQMYISYFDTFIFEVPIEVFCDTLHPPTSFLTVLTLSLLLNFRNSVYQSKFFVRYANGLWCALLLS